MGRVFRNGNLDLFSPRPSTRRFWRQRHDHMDGGLATIAVAELPGLAINGDQFTIVRLFRRLHPTNKGVLKLLPLYRKRSMVS